MSSVPPRFGRSEYAAVRRLIVRVVFAAACLAACWPGSTSAAEGEPRDFPRELVAFRPADAEPLFQGSGAGKWDAKIRERGWILRDGDSWRLWYTGYDGTREGVKRLGLATSSDGVRWTRASEQPLVADLWIEDMMVVVHDKTYHMFAEGRDDQAQRLTSPDGVHWTRAGTLDIRQTNGRPIPPGPFGTPTALCDDGVWRLLFERSDKGVWLAESRDLKVWTLVQDEPVLVPGPGPYDKVSIALNQIIKHRGRYFAYYHGSGDATRPQRWTSNVAVSDDLRRWTKFAGNPLVENNESSPQVVADGDQFRLYTTHDQVRLHRPAR